MTNNIPAGSSEVVVATSPSRNTYPTYAQVLILVGVFLLAQLPAALPILGFKVAAESFEIPSLNAVGEMLGYTLNLLLTIWFALRKRGNRTLSFASVRASAYLVSAIGLIAMVVLAEPIVSAIPMPDALQAMVERMFTKNVILSAVIAAPVLEEILFRGIILDGFLNNYRPAQAIIWSGVVFGAIHFIPAQALNAAFIGIALGWLYYRTRSLTLCIFLHFINNSLSSLTLLTDEGLNMSENQTRVWVGNDAYYIGLLIGCLVVCIVCYRFLNRTLPN